MRRSGKAPVSRSDPKISNSSSEPVFDKDVAQLVHDQQVLLGELFLEAQKTFFVARLEQLADQRRGGGKADPIAFLTSGQP